MIKPLKKRPGEVRLSHTDDFHPVANPAHPNQEVLESSLTTEQPIGESAKLWQRVRQTIFGKPIAEQLANQQRLNPVRALAILSSDALSSVAYGTEASLVVLLAAGSSALALNLGIGLAIALLMVIVGNSYRQTIFAYPHGGGSYTVARENLGVMSGLVAAASLSVDYILTVAVSVAAGIDALGSAFPQLGPYKVGLDLLAIALIVLVNLRGVRESGTVFAIPTYLFLGSFGLMLVTGIVRVVTHGGFTAAAAPPVTQGTQQLTVLLVLTAFASGCSAMTGVEAISNGVPIFSGNDVQQQSKNAARTLVTMISILAIFYLSTTYLAWRLGIVPTIDSNQTVTAMITRFAFTGELGWLFYVVQIATLLILVFAANTSFAGFPRLASILARDKFLPAFFAYRGERLAFNTGILVLGSLSALILVAFQGNVTYLINLYALGVFISFTLSQVGMVRHWARDPQAGARGWRMFSNGLGAVTTGIVSIVIAIAKFDRGVWVVLIVVPLLVGMFKMLSGYYNRARNFHLENLPSIHKDVAIVPIFDVRDIVQELTYAQEIADHVIAVRVVNDEAEALAFQTQWEHDPRWTPALREKIQLEIVQSPYRTIVLPLARFAEWSAARTPAGETLVVILPQRMQSAWWEFLLHRRMARRVRAILQHETASYQIQVVNVPYTLG